MNNACRYSRSERVHIEVRAVEKEILIEIRDWGEGFDPEQVGASHFGLQGIRERARLLGGIAEVRSAPGQGTTLRVTLPAKPVAADV